MIKIDTLPYELRCHIAYKNFISVDSLFESFVNQFFDDRQHIIDFCLTYPQYAFELLPAIDTTAHLTALIYELIRTGKSIEVGPEFWECIKEYITTPAGAVFYYTHLHPDPDILDRIFFANPNAQLDAALSGITGDTSFSRFVETGDVVIVLPRLACDVKSFSYLSHRHFASPKGEQYIGLVHELGRAFIIGNSHVVRWVQNFPEEAINFMDRIDSPYCMFDFVYSFPFLSPMVKDRITSGIVIYQWAEKFPNDAEDMLDRVLCLEYAYFWLSRFCESDRVVLESRIVYPNVLEVRSEDHL